MKYQFIVWLGLSLLLSIPLRAQNSIDRMVEEYSAIGGSKFTSAVERDPNTSRVKSSFVPLPRRSPHPSLWQGVV